MKIQLLHPNVITPIRSTIHSAGFDLFMPENGCIPAHDTVKVGLGFASEIPEGWVALILPRSGVGSKFGVELNNTCGVIDADYRGEWFATLGTKTGVPYGWARGDRILQAVLVPRYTFEIEVVESVSKTDRGEGGLGSTGT